MNYSEEIFEMLGVKPYEEFYLSDQKKNKYRINKNLKLELDWNGWINSGHNISELLIDTSKIIKIPKLTKEDHIIIDYARLCGYNWIAQNKNEYCHAFVEEPIRDGDSWTRHPVDHKKAMFLPYPLSFLLWENEPYYIGSEKNDDSGNI